MQRGLHVVDSAGQVAEVDTGEGVGRASAATDLNDVGVFCGEDRYISLGSRQYNSESEHGRPGTHGSVRGVVWVT